MSGIIQDIVKKVKSFHGNVETFLDARIKEASFNKLIKIMLIIGLIVGISSILMTYNHNLNDIFTTFKSMPQNIISIFLEYFIIMNLGFAIQASIIAISAGIVRKLNKSTTKMLQPKLLQIVYSFLVVIAIALFASLFITLLGLAFSSPPGHSSTVFGIFLGVIGDILGLFFAYVLLILCLRLFRLSLVEYIEFVIAGVIITFALGILIFILVIAFGLVVFISQRYF